MKWYIQHQVLLFCEWKKLQVKGRTGQRRPYRAVNGATILEHMLPQEEEHESFSQLCPVMHYASLHCYPEHVQVNQ